MCRMERSLRPWALSFPRLGPWAQSSLVHQRVHWVLTSPLRAHPPHPHSSDWGP